MTSSYAEQARRFLAERAGVAGARCDESDGRLRRPDLSSLSSQPDSGSSAPAEQAASCEQSDESDERVSGDGVWWDDRVPASSAPVFYLPPRTCLGPRICARVGPCERHKEGEPCEIISPRRASVPEGDSR